MSFEIDLLCKRGKGKFALCWIAATRGVKKLTTKQILSVDVVTLCDEIKKVILSKSLAPRARFSLSLAAKLINGAARINHRKAELLQVFGVKTKRGKKVKLTPPIIMEDPVAVAEKYLTDEDVERALLDAQRADEHLITIREEIPPKTFPREDEGGFSDILNLGEHDPLEISDELFLQQLEELSAVELPPVQIEEEREEPVKIITEVSVHEPPKKVVEPKTRKYDEKPIEEFEPLKKRAKHVEKPADEIERLEHVEEPIQIEEVELPRPVVPEEEIRLAEKVAKKKLSVTKKFTISDKLPKVRNIMRCSEQDNEFFDVETVREPFLSLYTSIYDEDIYQLPEFMTMISQFLDMETIKEISKLREPRTLSRLTSKFEALRRRMMPTPHVGIPSRRETRRMQKELAVDILQLQVEAPPAVELLPAVEIPQPEVEIPERQPEMLLKLPERESLFITPEKLPPTAGRTALTGEVTAEPKRPITYEKTFEEIMPPAAHKTFLPEGIFVRDFTRPEKLPPVAENTAAVTEEVTIETAEPKRPIVYEKTFEEIMPPAAHETERSERIVVRESPTESTKKLMVKERRRAIVKQVKKWNYDLKELTIEDVCTKPINRLNMAVAFSDLYVGLSKDRYVTLTPKQGTIELGSIEKGEKLQMKR